MVVHVAPGHHTGTLVNALLHHCSLPALDLAPTEPGGVVAVAGRSSGGGAGAGEEQEADELEEEDEEEEESAQLGSSRLLSSSSASSSSSGSRILRPGIVHRIDKGTSGLIVVAKTETALTRLQVCAWWAGFGERDEPARGCKRDSVGPARGEG